MSWCNSSCCRLAVIVYKHCSNSYLNVVYKTYYNFVTFLNTCSCLLLFHNIQDDSLLVIGWGTYVKIALIKTNQNKDTNGTYRHIQMSSMNKVDIVASFQTSYFISGIAPFGDTLVVLAYIPGEEDGEKEFSSTIPSRQVVISSFAFLEIFFFIMC